MTEGNCTGLHPYGPCAPNEGCNRPMTADQPPPAAVQIMLDAVDELPQGASFDRVAAAVYAALAERYAFVDHAEYARLVAVVEVARAHVRADGEPYGSALYDAVVALDAAPAETASGDACDGGGVFRQHPDTGLVQRVHADGGHHMPSLDPRCAETVSGVRTYDQLTEQAGGPPNERVNEWPAGRGLPRLCP